MKFIELTDIDGQSVLFNINHITSIYTTAPGSCYTRIITTDCYEDEYYDVQESISTIKARLQFEDESMVITNKKDMAVETESPTPLVYPGIFNF